MRTRPSPSLLLSGLVFFGEPFTRLPWDNLPPHPKATLFADATPLSLPPFQPSQALSGQSTQPILAGQRCFLGRGRRHTIGHRTHSCPP